MRILFISCHLPYPPFSGGRRREYELLTRTAERAEVDLLAVTKDPEEDLAHVEAARAVLGEVVVLPARRRTEGGLAPQVALHRAAAARSVAAELLLRRRHDVIHCEGFYMLQHVPRAATLPLVLGEQNVEWRLWEQRARQARGAKRIRLQRAARSTRTAEMAAWSSSDVCMAVTEEDRADIAAQAPNTRVVVVPDGADHSSSLPGASPQAVELANGDAPLVVVPGNFAYEPTRQAARRFCVEIMPRVRARVPHAHVALVGNAPPEDLRRLAGPEFHVTGRVPAMEPYLDAADVVACPLWVGGGVKVKVLEALARGKALVTTPLGVQGLPGPARSPIQVAAGPAEFAQAVADLLLDAELRARREAAARVARRVLPAWDEAAEALFDLYERVTRGEPDFRRPAIAAASRAAAHTGQELADA